MKKARRRPGLSERSRGAQLVGVGLICFCSTERFTLSEIFFRLSSIVVPPPPLLLESGAPGAPTLLSVTFCSVSGLSVMTWPKDFAGSAAPFGKMA